jgi:hypothetical protein
VKGFGARLLNLGVAGAFVMAVVGWPVLGLAIVGVLWVLIRLESRA